MGCIARLEMKLVKPNKIEQSKFPCASPQSKGKVGCIQIQLEHPKLKQYQSQLRLAINAANTAREVEVDYHYELQKEIQKQSTSTELDTDCVPDSFLPLLARLVQGSRLGQTALAAEVHSVFTQSGISIAQEAITAKILRIADRKPYGAKPKDCSLWEVRKFFHSWCCLL